MASCLKKWQVHLDHLFPPNLVRPSLLTSQTYLFCLFHDRLSIISASSRTSYPKSIWWRHRCTSVTLTAAHSLVLWAAYWGEGSWLRFCMLEFAWMFYTLFGDSRLNEFINIWRQQNTCSLTAPLYLASPYLPGITLTASASCILLCCLRFCGDNGLAAATTGVFLDIFCLNLHAPTMHVEDMRALHLIMSSCRFCLLVVDHKVVWVV